MKKSMISLFLIIFITCLCIGDIHAETIRMKQVYVPEKQVSIAFPEYYITCEKEDTELDTRLVAEGITLTGMKNLFKKYNSIYIYGFPPDFDGDLNVAISYTPGVSSLAELDQITLNLLRNSYEKQLSGAEIKLLSREEVQIGDNLFFVGKIHKTDLNMDCIQYMTIVDEQTISITLTCGNISAEREDMLKQMVEASTFNKHIAGEVEPTDAARPYIQYLADHGQAKPELVSVRLSKDDHKVVTQFKKNGVSGMYALWECFDKKSEENMSGGGYDIEEDNGKDIIEVRQGMLDAVPGETLSIWIRVIQEDGTDIESDPVELQIPITDILSPITVSACSIADLDKTVLEKLFDQVAEVYYNEGYEALRAAEAEYYKKAVHSEFVTTGTVTVLLISPNGMKCAFSASGTPDVKEGDYLCFNDGLASSFAFRHIPIEEGQYTLKVFDRDKMCLIGTWYFNVKSPSPDDAAIRDKKDESSELVKKISVGDTVTFGRYEQDGDLGNGKEDIEWLALDVRGEDVLLISKYALDAKTYDNAWRAITWETCSLRKWLNEDFIDLAFNNDEQNAILMTRVDNSQAQGYSGWTTYSGNDTDDRIFLLSYLEAWKYFPNDESRICSATDWAAQQGAAVGKTAVENACVWWLRSPGDEVFRAFAVNGKGTGYGMSGIRADREGATVRPALWVRMQPGS